MYYTPMLWRAEDQLCNVSSDDLNACCEEAEFRSTIPCDEDVYAVCVDIIRRDHAELPKNFSEAIDLYLHLKREILML